MSESYRSIPSFLAALIAAAAAASTARAATVVVPAVRDASIFANLPDNGSGGGNGLFAGADGNGSVRRALVTFDLSALPSGAIVQSAELTLHLGQFAGMGGGGSGGTLTSTVGLHRLVATWGEAATQAVNPPNDSFVGIGQGAPALEGDVTWDSRFHSPLEPVAWTQPGGDFAPTPSASLAVGRTTGAAFVWPSTPAVVSDVQNWLDQPATNHGWMLVHADESISSSFRAFYSRNVATAAFHPRLTIVYELGLAADFDGDRDVDGADLLIWQRGVGITSGATRGDGDATGDGVVTGLDLDLWKEQFAAPPPTVRAVPEPRTLASVLLLLVATRAENRRRRRRLP